ncbi:conserved hypothetical protein [Pseudomonas sp. OF001]|jgi:hypothetical protein|uniref:hypothetical protein n=1 Tax=unclassified Pseudomonas TaxID=196821 RepID=UPI001455CC19|nr:MULTISPECIES: hypothetical protein [unclassified Pseudomonas]MCQ4347481.1 hypothetical protein [Stutzerimonas stutzeri]WPP47200.1 hypothetical protein SK095_07405 [Pseudomonas sp. AN-1]CAD5379427.1 conserved hypothetical protein [Pseudomonas sp. OF001]
MRALRDEDDYDDYPRRAPAPRRERRLAWEIALGIWLGGMALAVTSGLGWLLVGALAITTLRFGI